ncbi:NUDIX domain-containing protein [Bacillus cereus]|nr:NUDIX domain-containing protein [Bacillus cereus]
MFNINALTNNQPFCAGVILIKNKKVVTTLNTDGLPEQNKHLYRVGAVGGGQEPGEKVLDCALREAFEETSTIFNLLNSPITYLYDMDNIKLQKIKCVDNIAPFFIEFKRNTKPYKPYKKELPTGPYTYFVMYLAVSSTYNLCPNDDVEGLLMCPIHQWKAIEKGITLTEALGLGCDLIENYKNSIDRNRRLWVNPDESMRKITKLLKNHPRLINFDFSTNKNLSMFLEDSN